MSPLSSGRQGPYRKPRVDIYTCMLAIALVALIIGCVCLYLEVADYGEAPYQLGSAAPLEADPPFGAALAQRPQAAAPAWQPFLATGRIPLIHG